MAARTGRGRGAASGQRHADIRHAVAQRITGADFHRNTCIFAHALKLVDKRHDKTVKVRAGNVLKMTPGPDPDLKSRDRVVKKSEKDSLYAAMDVAAVWLERALASK